MKNLYIRDNNNNKIHYVDNIKEFLTSNNDNRIGYHDYPLEFSHKDNFLYLHDRDDENLDDDIKFKTIEELCEILISHTNEKIVTKFLINFANNNLYISDNFNTIDYSIENVLSKLIK